MAGVFVGASAYFKRTRMLGGVIALIAATIGGSFNLTADQALLLVMFVFIGICGNLLFRALQQK